MKITLIGDDAVRFDPEPGPLTIEAPTVEQTYSPFHMFGSSLAVCTHSVLHSWATHARLNADDLAIEVRWSFAERPHRVGAVELTLDWASLPESRREAARRATALCPIHATLSHPPSIEVRLAADARPAAATSASAPAAHAPAPAPPTPPAPVAAGSPARTP